MGEAFWLVCNQKRGVLFSSQNDQTPDTTLSYPDLFIYAQSSKKKLNEHQLKLLILPATLKWSVPHHNTPMHKQIHNLSASAFLHSETHKLQLQNISHFNYRVITMPITQALSEILLQNFRSLSPYLHFLPSLKRLLQQNKHTPCTRRSGKIW